MANGLSFIRDSGSWPTKIYSNCDKNSFHALGLGNETELRKGRTTAFRVQAKPTSFAVLYRYHPLHSSQRYFFSSFTLYSSLHGLKFSPRLQRTTVNAPSAFEQGSPLQRQQHEFLPLKPSAVVEVINQSPKISFLFFFFYFC